MQITIHKPCRHCELTGAFAKVGVAIHFLSSMDCHVGLAALLAMTAFYYTHSTLKLSPFPSPNL